MTVRTYLTTRQAALILGCTTAYIYEEITRSRRLEAQIVPRQPSPGRTRGQAAIRIYPQPFTRYVQTYWPEKLQQWQQVERTLVSAA